MTYGSMGRASAMYQDTSARGAVEGADRHQLTSMLYDGVVLRLHRAKVAIERNDFPAKGDNFSKAQAILVELRASLDHQAGGKLAARLDALYEYIGRRLLEAQLAHDPAPVTEAIGLLTPLRDAWKEIRPGFLSGQAKLAVAS